jgi:hypothetical protein
VKTKVLIASMTLLAASIVLIAFLTGCERGGVSERRYDYLNAEHQSLKGAYPPTPESGAEAQKMEARGYDISDLVDALAEHPEWGGMRGYGGAMGGMGMGGMGGYPGGQVPPGYGQRMGMMGGMGGYGGMMGGMGGVRMAVPESESATARILAELATVREDEIWVVARETPEGPQAAGPEYETPGSGAMLAQIQ